MDSTVEKVMVARKASIGLANLSTTAKNRALFEVAKALQANRKIILKANRADVRAAGKAGLSKVLIKRLDLSDDKISELVRSVRSVERLEDPVGRTLEKTELDRNLVLHKVSCPIGVIGVIFESRPEVGIQVASLCLKSGNAVILKGGSEAKRSNRLLYEIMRAASERAGLPRGWVQLLESREEVSRMLRLNEHINLVIPRGSNRFVKYVQAHTKIPVLGHSEGVCHAYVDSGANLKKAWDVCLDAKVQYPAVCNAIETLLVHRDIAPVFLPEMAARYAEHGVEIRGDSITRHLLKGFKVRKALEKDWRTEYNDLIISVKVVRDIDEAVEHINSYGSGHTDMIMTEDGKAAQKFLSFVDSSSVMRNCSTRFADGFRYGLGTEVGISTNKIHARGPVGLEGLTIYKYLLLGDGQIVADYVGKNARKYTHRKLKAGS
ncbi:MAG: glutamate-5-semialdehyde dehydrogenase [Candidatus Altiarchaeota archaeon]